jgi:hypothetical protein
MSAAFTTNGCAGAHPPLAFKLTRVFLSYPAFQRIRVVLTLTVAATFGALMVCHKLEGADRLYCLIVRPEPPSGDSLGKTRGPGY